MARKTYTKLAKMLTELKKCFRQIEHDNGFFRSENVTYAKILSNNNEYVDGWHVWIKLEPEIQIDLSDISDIHTYLPGWEIPYAAYLDYDKDGVCIVYCFTLKDWFDERDF